MMKRRKLPIGGVQTFSTLRNEFDVYIDKTAHIYEMASRYPTVFLARPRRFGKSLLCSTVESLFRGDRALFDGLAIAKTDWEWKPYPVIYLDLSTNNYTDNGVETLKTDINNQLNDCATNYGIKTDFCEYISINFRCLISELHRAAGRVVVIVDEYDNPLFNTLHLPELHEKLREELKGFYSVIKQSNRYIRFALVTGITKFLQVSAFSGMNQFYDISMRPEYCDICGITQEELETVFAPEIEMYAPQHGGRVNYLKRLREYYNGYCFNENNISVYNTYGLLNHFANSAAFQPYWSMSGWPSFMQRYLEKKDVNIAEIENAVMNAGSFGYYKNNALALFPLLYQAGYLTISDYNERTYNYKLTYPNIEVRTTFATFLADNYSKAEETLKDSTSVSLINSLLAGKPDDFMNLLKTYLTKVDYSLSSKITEYYFEFAVSNIINMLGLECKNEVHTANGRMDSVIFAGDYIYILEFKVDKPVEDALWQLEEKDYAAIYADSGKKLVKVGVVFSREGRNIVGWTRS